MVKGNKIINENDKKHIEMLLSKDVKPAEIAEIIGTSRSTVGLRTALIIYAKPLKKKRLKKCPI